MAYKQPSRGLLPALDVSDELATLLETLGQEDLPKERLIMILERIQKRARFSAELMLKDCKGNPKIKSWIERNKFQFSTIEG